MSSAPKIVVLGMLTKIPVAGAIWQNIHYLLGLRRLGFDVYYVEAHARVPTALMQHEDDDAALLAATFLDRTLRPFDLGDHWAYHALHDDGRCYGMSLAQLQRLYREAAMIVNLHGGTVPLPEHAETGRLVYLETDPVELQIELYDKRPEAVEFAAAHGAFATWGLNYGSEDCLVPLPADVDWLASPPPVLLDLWPQRDDEGDCFTTVGNWRQWGEVYYQGGTYTWSKHQEFLKFLDLPRQSGDSFELMLGASSYTEDDARLLEKHGWRVRSAASLSDDLNAYRDYVAGSRGEFTVAKEQNVVLRSGWFSERSAAYLAAGRPVITQDTGFGNYLPTGEGLFAFSLLEQILAAVDAVSTDYGRQSRAAREIAHEFFDADVVLPRLLAHYGVSVPRRRLPRGLVLQPVSRKPVRLPTATVEAALALPFPEARHTSGTPDASVVIVTRDNLAFTKLCLYALLENTHEPAVEVIVIDNASTDGTPEYLTSLATRNALVRVVLNDHNRGFAAATNQGLVLARGAVLVLLNNDTVLAPGWLRSLVAHLEDPDLGLIGAVTNRIGNEAQVHVHYRTYGEFLREAGERAERYPRQRFELPTATMFCLAMRRDVYERLGPLDERFGLGLLEDDDYSARAREAGYTVACAEDVLVHHFGGASFGELVAGGEYMRLLRENQRRFEEKWGEPWQPYERRRDESYERTVEHVRTVVHDQTARGSTVLVVSRGDESLTHFDGRHGWHFPQQLDGVPAGHYPADSHEAISQLEELRSRGARYLVFPQPSLWWLDFYEGLRRHLEEHHRVLRREQECEIFELAASPSDQPTSPR